MFCPVRAFDGRHRISFRRIPFFVRTGETRSARLLGTVTSALSRGICRTSSRRHGDLRLTTIFVYGFAGRVCTLTTSLLRGCGLPFRIVLPLVSRATHGMRRLTPHSTRAKPTMHCSRGIVDGRLTVLISSPTLRRVCGLVDGDVRRRRGL